MRLSSLELQGRTTRNVVEAHLSASPANKGAIPSRVFLRESQMIVPPEYEDENQEDDRSKEDIHLHGKSGYWRRTGRDENGISKESGEGNHEAPHNEPNVGPLPRRAEKLRKLCPMNALRDRPADEQIRSVAPEQKRAEPSSRVYVTDVLLVCQRNLLQVPTVAIGAA